MAGRIQETRREETKAVKVALKSAGINGKIRHGTGTAWSWLYIYIGAGQQWGEHLKSDNGSFGCSPGCSRCKNIHATRESALSIVQEVTGRHGEYDGNIIIMIDS